MNKPKTLTGAERQAAIAELDLLPQAEANRCTDGLLRNMLATPPEPFTPKAAPKKRGKK